MTENEMSGEELLLDIYFATVKELYFKSALQTPQVQKVTGANILFIGLGNGVTAQFEYQDEKNWKLTFGKGDVE